MKHLLQINSSIFSDDGQSSRLADEFVQQWQQSHGETRVTLRDFSSTPVPHLSADTFQAFLTPEAERNTDQKAAVEYSDQLIGEIRNADVIVLGLPMYNFGVPSQLKAWFDHIARAGVTFRYTANGPEGLLKNKKLFVLAARGGIYKGTAKDTQTEYVKNFFNLIGINDVEFIYAEGLNMGAEQKEISLTNALQDVTRLAA